MSSRGLLFVVVALLGSSVLTEQSLYVDDTPFTLFWPAASSTASGVDVCKHKSQETRDVRVYSVVTADGSEFFRHFVNEIDEQCFSDSESQVLGTAVDFSYCAHTTASLKFNSFTFNDGLCTAYKTWRPKEMSNCFPGATGVPVYVVDTQLSDFTRPNTDLLVTVTPSNRGGVNVDLEVEVYDPCHYQGSYIHRYQIEYNDAVVHREGYVLGEKLTYTLVSNDLCADDEFEVVVKILGRFGTILAGPVVQDIPDDSLTRKMLETGNCVIISDDDADYETSKSFCDSLGLTMFTEENDGDFATYASAMRKVKSTSGPGGQDEDEDHYVYLLHNSGQWTWQGTDVDQPDSSDDPTIWRDDNGARVCCRSDEGEGFLLKSKFCDQTTQSIVCHQKLPLE